jgi:O-antigen/teichoic acid export membrane protein
MRQKSDLKRRRTGQNVIALLAGQVLSKLLALWALILLANTLGTDLFGKYSFAAAFAMLFMPLMDLGLDTYGIREIARDPDRAPAYLGNILWIKIFLSALVIPAMWAAVSLMKIPALTVRLVLVSGVITLVRVFSNSLITAFRGFQRMEYEAALLILARLLETAAVLAGIRLGFSVEIILALMFAANVMAFIALGACMAATLVRPLLRMAPDLWPKLLRGGLPFMLTSIFVMIYFKIANVFLARMEGDAAVGLYDSAANLIYPLTVISSAIISAVFPVISRYFHSDRERAVAGFTQAAKYSFLIALPLAAGIFFLADPVMRLLYSEAYLPAVAVLRIICWLIPVIFTTNMLGNTLGAVDKQEIVFGISVANAMVNVTLNFLLIRAWGINGAALATVLTEIGGFFMLSHYLKKHFAPVQFRGTVLRILVSTLVMLPVLLLRDVLALPLLVPAAMAVYSAALFATRAVSMEEFRNLTSLFKQGGAEAHA